MGKNKVLFGRFIFNPEVDRMKSHMQTASREVDQKGRPISCTVVFELIGDDTVYIFKDLPNTDRNSDDLQFLTDNVLSGVA